MADVTIKDIAKHAGVSVATVSRVINGSEGVRPATITKVLDSIEKYQYTPNAVARHLRTDSTNLFAMLVSNISNNHFTVMAKAIESSCKEHGYSLLIFNTDDNPEIERDHLHRLTELRVDGLILNTTSLNNEYVATLSHRIPTVLIDRSIPHPDFLGDFIGSNDFDGMRLLTKHLTDLGHRRIGIISSNPHTSTGKARLVGFQTAMKEIGISISDDYEYRYRGQHFNENDGINGARYLMSLETPPTAIVVSNNDMALGLYKFLRSQNIRVPEDVSVVSYGTIRNSELFGVVPTFTTLNPSYIGEKAAELLLSRVQNTDRSNREIIFEPLLLVNGSTQPVK